MWWSVIESDKSILPTGLEDIVHPTTAEMEATFWRAVLTVAIATPLTLVLLKAFRSVSLNAKSYVQYEMSAMLERDTLLTQDFREMPLHRLKSYISRVQACYLVTLQGTVASLKC